MSFAQHLALAANRARVERFADRDVVAGPPPVEVLRYWRAKKLRIGFDHRDVWREEHDYSFTAAKVMRLDVLEALQEELDRTFEQGIPYAQFAKNIEPRLRELGWWDTQQVEDPLTGEVVQVHPPSRLARIYETNMRSARAVGQYDRIQRNKDSRPYLLYQVGPSARHREQHLAWHGVLLPVDDDFWTFAFPPNGWGCKCHVRTVSDREYRALVRDGVVAPSPEPVLDDEGLPTGHTTGARAPVQTVAPKVPLLAWANKRTGITEFVPAGIDPGFDKLPGEGRTQAMLDGEARLTAGQKAAATKKRREEERKAAAGGQGTAPGPEPVKPPVGAPKTAGQKAAETRRRKEQERREAEAKKGAAPPPPPGPGPTPPPVLPPPGTTPPKTAGQKAAETRKRREAERRAAIGLPPTPTPGPAPLPPKPARERAPLHKLRYGQAHPQYAADDKTYKALMATSMLKMKRTGGDTFTGPVSSDLRDFIQGQQRVLADHLGLPIHGAATRIVGQDKRMNMRANGSMNVRLGEMTLKIDKYGQAAYKTVVHELIHTMGGVDQAAYRGSAMAIEEAATEELSQAYRGSKRVSNYVPAVDLADTDGAYRKWHADFLAQRQFQAEGSYAHYRDPIFSLVMAANGGSAGRADRDEQTHDRVVSAMLQWKQTRHHELLPGQNPYVHALDNEREVKKAVNAFVECLKPKSEEERAFYRRALHDQRTWMGRQYYQ